MLDDVNFQGRKVLVRVDFNVPLNADLEITDDARIRAALPTIKKILNDGGSVIAMSHLGRPKDGPENKFSSAHLVDTLATLSEAKVHFSSDCIGQEAAQKAAEIAPGEILLLENLRFHPEEKAGDEVFAQKLASLGDYYVNDAFGTAHRAHASTAVIAKFFPGNKSFGYLMAKELDNAEKVLSDPGRPFTAIVGGAKVSDKLLILEKLMNIADNILIGGGMSYTFIKAKHGNIGNSLCEDERLDLTIKLMEMAEEKGVKLMLPEDSVIANDFSNSAETGTCKSNDIPEGWMGLDIGPDATEDYRKVIAESKTVLWNGPMGVFEMSNFANGTRETAMAVAEATDNGAFSLIGGGDSASAIKKFDLVDRVSYVSTGGGALLEYFEGKELPGVAAINA